VSPNDYISPQQFREADGTRGWAVLSNGATTFIRTDSFADSVRLVRSISELDGIEDHPPKIDIRSDGVTVRLLTTEARWWGMSRRDIEFARRISGAAADLGLSADATAVQSVDPIIIGAADIKRIMPFWQAILAYEQRADSPDEDLVDPQDRGPGIWFEKIEGAQQGRNRMHIAVWIPYEQAEARIAAAIAAGGKMIYDEQAPAWWTLADPEGNEADIATTNRSG
jgi:4a-hydroxytetrahydrobiopterin dehydratase